MGNQGVQGIWNQGIGNMEYGTKEYGICEYRNREYGIWNRWTYGIRNRDHMESWNMEYGH